MTSRVSFNRSILAFLKQQGYSHIYNSGIIGESENYLLIPLRPGDPRLKYGELDKLIEEIGSNDIYDMVDGDEFITFLVELPEQEIETYKSA